MISRKRVTAALLLSLVLACAGTPLPTEPSMLVVVPPSPEPHVAPKQPGDVAPAKVATDDLVPKITSMNVECNVTLRYAKTLVTSKVVNPATKAKEVTFSVVIPETAFITGFSMELAGKVYEAYVKEKEEAKKVYQSAVSSGLAAAHVAVQTRDSNHFTVSVNVESASKAIFRLTYEELLVRRLGRYNLVANLNPGQLVDELTVDVDIQESLPITSIFVPELRTGNEIDAEPNETSNKFSTQTISDDKLSAKIHFSPSKAEQIELMKIFQEKQKEMSTPSPHHFNPFETEPDSPSLDDGLSGQFVVQYDVNRKDTGEVLVNDGYFVHFFAPSNLEPLNKHVIFVLDISGSMIGRKINQLKEAMNSILKELNPGDFFHIISFSYSAKVYHLDDPSKHAIYRSGVHDNFYGYNEESNVERSPEVPPPAKPATAKNIAKAKEIIDNLHATGGTNIYDALTTALKVANYGTQVAKDLGKPLPEPMVIFLTDGDPTVGETNTEKIMSAVSELNTERTAVFSLAFGEDADRSFLRKVSLQNFGFLRHIYEAADAAQQLRNFYRMVASPLLANISYTYPDDQIDEKTITQHKFQYFFLGSEMVFAGRLQQNHTLGNDAIKVNALSSTGPIDFIPIVPQEGKTTNFWPLERMWAHITIKQLLDEKDKMLSKSDDSAAKELSNKALNLALQYSFVTPLTSLVVVKPNSTSAVDAESLQGGGYGGAVPLSGVALPLLANMPAYPPCPGCVGSGFSGASGGLALSGAGYPGPVHLGGRLNHYPAAPSHSSGFIMANSKFAGIPDHFASYPTQGLRSGTAYSVVPPPRSHYNRPHYKHSRPSSAYAGLPPSGPPGYSQAYPASSISRQPPPFYPRPAALPGMPQPLWLSPLSHASASAGGLWGSPQSALSGPARPIADDAVLSYVDRFDTVDSSMMMPETHLDSESDSDTIETTMDVVVATPLRPVTTTRTPPTTTAVESPLKEYGLEKFSWLQPYLVSANHSLALPLQETEPSVLTYKLQRISSTYEKAAESACTNSVGGGAGTCQYLTSCKDLDSGFKDLSTYLKHHCDSNGFAGICCAHEDP